jgi:prepilin-type N-terminal cleavage/methylation domain-containing protein
MRTSCKKNGFSLTEMIVVIAIVALLTALGLPAIHSLQKSFESGSGTKAIIDAALSTARAIAAKEQRYAGVRFQLDLTEEQGQYMIFIIHNPEKTKLSNGFRALEGQKPIKLPEDVRVIDMLIHTSANQEEMLNGTSNFLEEIDTENLEPSHNNRFLRDMSCFSVIFSPMGKEVIHEVRVRNKDGIYQPANGQSNDDIFNSPASIQNGNTGMFIQDDYSEYGLGSEMSRDKFYMYEKSYFNKLSNSQDRFDYLRSLKPAFINQYTGTIVNSGKYQ